MEELLKFLTDNDWRNEGNIKFTKGRADGRYMVIELNGRNEPTATVYENSAGGSRVVIPSSYPPEYMLTHIQNFLNNNPLE